MKDNITLKSECFSVWNDLCVVSGSFSLSFIFKGTVLTENRNALLSLVLSGDSILYTGRSSYSSWSKWDWGHTHHHQQRPAAEPPQGENTAHTTHTSQLISYQELLSLMLSLSQAILMDVPRLKHIIVVDKKRTSWPDLPRGIMVHNMATVQELGSKPENSKSQVAYYFVWNVYMHTIIFAWCIWSHMLLLVYSVY